VRGRAPVHHRPVPRIAFTPQLQRFTETPEFDTPATTLRQALEAAFVLNPRLRGYVLDDQGGLRPNVVVFIDGRRCADRPGDPHRWVNPEFHGWWSGRGSARYRSAAGAASPTSARRSRRSSGSTPSRPVSRSCTRYGVSDALVRAAEAARRGLLEDR